MAERTQWTRVTYGGHELDLLTAWFQRHTYTRHTHETFAIGVVLSGSERFRYRGALHHAGIGSVAILGPGEPHDGEPATDDGWSYRVLYPHETLLGHGRLHFPEPVVVDARLAHLVRAAHVELTDGADPLAGQSRLTWALEALVSRHACRPAAGEGPPSGADPVVRRAVQVVRDRMTSDLTSTPSLRELAALADLSPYHLLRVFRADTGFPPHTWLVLHRVHRARLLLAAGATAASTSTAVGFADQAHLTRWFKRVVGVTPAAYRNSVQDPVRRGL